MAQVFKGIPYAEAPARFSPPRPWRGSLEPTGISAHAPQLDLLTGRPGGDEDCLYVDIYAPSSPGPHPVMVWIHGGGGVTGSPGEYDGSLFAEHGIVVVVVGYRLGVLGLLYVPGVSPGNLSLMDQVTALRWVHDHIGSFGGDPARVTLAGESNGGRTVGTLMATPSAAGLFQQAIVQSGTGVGTVVHTPAEAAALGASVVAELGVADPRALRDIPVRRLLDAQAAVASASPIAVPYQVMVDGEVLPRRPIDAIADGASGDVRLLVGTNHDEQDLFAAITTSFSGSRSMVVAQDAFDKALASYRELLPELSEERVHRHAMTASEWWIPAIRLAEAHRGETYMYRLDWRLSETGMGAPHALDLIFVFGGRGIEGLSRLFQVPLDNPITEIMHGAWVDFIADGDPGWASYGRSRSTFVFDTESGPVEDPDRALRLVWDGVTA